MSYQLSELKHKYGDNVHVLANPFLTSRLAVLCQEKTTQPAINEMVSELYGHLITNVINREFPQEAVEIKTRMASLSPLGIWRGQVIAPSTKTVVVNVMRAGTLPSQVCYDQLNKTLDPDQVRQDHLIVSRVVDESEQVTGSKIGAGKIGGSVDDAIVLFPDPMGATGSSLIEVISHYKDKIDGNARKFIALNLMITPEYIRNVKAAHPEAIIYALRLDRAASSERALATTPGHYWNEESGLSDKQYILPGGGGFGEIMNNAYC
ncbi:MAG: uracil phosphoribosyltransferase [Deltaproteobacteria bacterium]|nr:uracil phosphoribosyltransferase [Deltaproteobacteria bacterium]